MFELLDPSGERRVVIDVAFDHGRKAFGSERFEALVKIPAALAECRVVRIAECQDGIAQRGEWRELPVVESGVKRSGVVRWFSIAISGGDDQEVADVC